MRPLYDFQFFFTRFFSYPFCDMELPVFLLYSLPLIVFPCGAILAKVATENASLMKYSKFFSSNQWIYNFSFTLHRRHTENARCSGNYTIGSLDFGGNSLANYIDVWRRPQLLALRLWDRGPRLCQLLYRCMI